MIFVQFLCYFVLFLDAKQAEIKTEKKACADGIAEMATGVPNGQVCADGKVLYGKLA
jgi:hypothetical protein